MTNSGVGYSVFMAGSLLSQLSKGEACAFPVTTIVKEQEISLYGFGSKDEKTLFEKLITVSGIGPKTAIGMVSLPVSRFLSAVENGDVSFLTRIPGLGKKTAERLIIELRGKIDLQSPESATPMSHALKEASEALENLGYSPSYIQESLSKADQSSSAEDLVTWFLSSRS